MVSVSVVPVSPSTRHPAARRRSFSASPRSSPRKRPPGTRPSRETLPTGVLNVVKSVCVSLAVGPVRRRTRTPTSARPHHNKAVTQSLPRSTSTTEQSLSSAVSMEGLLQCVNCGENFDLERRRPKLLPCGHTQCHACVLGCVRDNRVVCPTDKLIVHVDAHNLQDDLQLICWLEATAQGLLECVRCGVPFDWLLRRPTALDCGHSVCRVCLQEACEAPEAPLRAQPRALALPLARADSIDESWDYYSQEDGDLDVRDGGNTCSSMSSLSSDEGVALSVGELLVDCPIEGCLKGVRARDHLHLLGCLDDSAAPRNRVKRAILCEDQLLEKLSKLERRIATMYSDAGSLQTPSGTLDGSADVSALLASVRQLVEHKDSPRSEPPVFKQILNIANCTLPDVVLNKAAFRGNEDVTGIYSIKESQIELDVYNLSMCKPGEMRVKKEAALRSDKKVWKLTGVDCWCDPEWTLRLLQRCAPHVEQLQLQYPGREHLQVVRDCMPLLRRLEVRGWCGLDLQSEPFIFDEGPACKRDTLEWLEVFLPPQTALSLLRAHRGSLRKLRLVVADEWASSETSPAACCDDLVPDVAEEAGVEDEWPEEDGFAVVPWGEDCVADIPTSCWDALLRECGGDVKDPVALASVSLLWLSPRAHDSWTCRRFARALHDARPGVAVECEVCRRYGCGGVAAE